MKSSNLPTVLAITEDELDLDSLLEKITLPTTGAAVIFTGMVRGVTSRHGSTQASRGEAYETLYLEYEAYRPMSEAKMRQIAEEIRQKWPSVEGIATVSYTHLTLPTKRIV